MASSVAESWQWRRETSGASSMNSAPVERPIVLTDPEGMRKVARSGADSSVSRIHIYLAVSAGRERFLQPRRNFQHRGGTDRAFRQRSVLAHAAGLRARQQVIQPGQVNEVRGLGLQPRSAQLRQLLAVKRGHFLVEIRLNHQQRLPRLAQRLLRIEHEKAAVQRIVHAPADVGRERVPSLAGDHRLKNRLLLFNRFFLSRGGGAASFEELPLLFEHEVDALGRGRADERHRCHTRVPPRGQEGDPSAFPVSDQRHLLGIDILAFDQGADDGAHIGGKIIVRGRFRPAAALAGPALVVADHDGARVGERRGQLGEDGNAGVEFIAIFVAGAGHENDRGETRAHLGRLGNGGGQAEAIGRDAHLLVVRARHGHQARGDRADIVANHGEHLAGDVHAKQLRALGPDVHVERVAGISKEQRPMLHRHRSAWNLDRFIRHAIHHDGDGVLRHDERGELCARRCRRETRGQRFVGSENQVRQHHAVGRDGEIAALVLPILRDVVGRRASAERGVDYPLVRQVGLIHREVDRPPGPVVADFPVLGREIERRPKPARSRAAPSRRGIRTPSPLRCRLPHL